MENCFDFQRALSSIYTDFKNRKVKNYELFKEEDLRNKWTEFELKVFRKDSDNNTYHYTKEDFFPEEKENINTNNYKKEKEEEEEQKTNDNNGFKVTILAKKLLIQALNISKNMKKKDWKILIKLIAIY